MLYIYCYLQIFKLFHGDGLQWDNFRLAQDILEACLGGNEDALLVDALAACIATLLYSSIVGSQDTNLFFSNTYGVNYGFSRDA